MKKRIIAILTVVCFMISFNMIFTLADEDGSDIEVVGLNLKSSAYTISFGESVTLTATLVISPDPDPDPEGDPDLDPDPDDPETLGTVTFYYGDDNELGTAEAPNDEYEYIVTIDNLPIGEHTIYAVYSEGDIESESIAIKVNKLNSAVTLQANAMEISVGYIVKLTATVAVAADGENVVFYDDIEYIGTAKTSNGIAELETDELPVGTRKIKAVFPGNSTYKESTSNILNLKILSDNNLLTRLLINDVEIRLYSNTTTYDVSYDNSVESIRIRPYFDSTAMATVYGWELESGDRSSYIPINEGTTSIILKIIAENGEEREYLIRTFRSRAASNNNSSSSNSGRSTRYRFAAQTEQIVYGDVAYHWAGSIIDSLTGRGIFTGEKIGSISYFYPDRNMNRTEFAVVIARMMNSDLDLTRYLDLPFEDSGSIPEWGLTEVRSVYFNKWIDGDGYNFKPLDNITRAEAMTIIARVTGHYGTQTGFSDSWDIPSWAQSAVAGLVNAGIVNGYNDNTIRPNATITRAEVAAMVSKIIR